jgi:hypothetical protein
VSLGAAATFVVDDTAAAPALAAVVDEVVAALADEPAAVLAAGPLE